MNNGIDNQLACNNRIWTLCHPSPTDAAIVDIAFFDSECGWILDSAGGLRVTQDGGNSWEVKAQAESAPGTITAMYFHDRAAGIIAISNGRLLVTGDCGKTWSAAHLQAAGHIDAIWFSDRSHGRLRGRIPHDESIDILDAPPEHRFEFSTSDGGKTWKEVFSAAHPDHLAIAWGSPKTGWQSSKAKGRLSVSHDGGSTWIATLVDHVICLRANDDAHVFALKFGGELLSSTDGGVTWTLKANLGMECNVISAASPEVLWADGDGKLSLSTDGGTTWHARYRKATSETLLDLCFVDSQHGWAVGGNGTIICTRDGGLNWSRQDSHTTNTLSCVHFINGERGWATGKLGTLLFTRDAGNTWVSDTSVSSDYLWSLCFADADTAWLVGAFGQLLRSTDKGESWRQTPVILAASGGNPPRDLGTPSFTDVHFFGTTDGWLLTRNSILHTDNGGQTWAIQLELPNALLHALSFTEGRIGCAVGKAGLALVTRDGGKMWTTCRVPTSADLHSVHVADGGRIVIAGDDGVLLESLDAGRDWSQISLITNSHLSCIISCHDQIWVGGTGGSIFRISKT